MEEFKHTENTLNCESQAKIPMQVSPASQSLSLQNISHIIAHITSLEKVVTYFVAFKDKTLR